MRSADLLCFITKPPYVHAWTDAAQVHSNPALHSGRKLQLLEQRNLHFPSFVRMQV